MGATSAWSGITVAMSVHTDDRALGAHKEGRCRGRAAASGFCYVNGYDYGLLATHASLKRTYLMVLDGADGRSL